MSMWTEAVSSEKRRKVFSVDLPWGFDIVTCVFKDCTEHAFRHITHELEL
jgi:hypothetical protein